MQGPKTSVILHQVCNSTATAAGAKPGNVSLPSDCILPPGACHQQLVLDVMTNLIWGTQIRYAAVHTASTSQCLAIFINALSEAGVLFESRHMPEALLLCCHWGGRHIHSATIGSVPALHSWRHQTAGARQEGGINILHDLTISGETVTSCSCSQKNSLRQKTSKRRACESSGELDPATRTLDAPLCLLRAGYTCR